MLQRELLEKLLKSFNLEESTIKAYGLKVHISAKDFQRIMGVPEGGTNIVLDGEEVVGRSEELKEFRVYSTRDCDRQTISTSLMRKTLKIKESSDLFVKFFILYEMGVLLVPNRRDDISLSSVYAVTDVADIPKKNWASYCFNELVKCIYNHNADGKKYMPDCLLFLELIFLEDANGIFHTIDESLVLMS